MADFLKYRRLVKVFLIKLITLALAILSVAGCKNESEKDELLKRAELRIQTLESDFKRMDAAYETVLKASDDVNVYTDEALAVNEKYKIAAEKLIESLKLQVTALEKQIQQYEKSSVLPAGMSDRKGF